MQHLINWFEIPVTDMPRAKAFYEQILQTEITVDQMGPFEMVFFKPGEQGSVSGALSKGEGCVPSDAGVMVYFSIPDDLQKVMDRIEGAGGKVVMPKMEISPEIGYCAFFTDTEGNRIGVHSPN